MDDVSIDTHWAGKIGCIEAEEKLRSRPVGDYLLHEPEYFVQWSANHSCVLTVVGRTKIVHKLLVRTDLGWAVRQDDPDMQDQEIYHYSFLQDCIQNAISSILRS